MNYPVRLLAPALLAVVAALPASAQPRTEAPGRFTMQPIEGGFLRLDTQTGLVSTCRPGAGNLVLCQPAQDEQLSLNQEIERLRNENSALKSELERLTGKPAPTPPLRAPDLEPAPEEKFQLPSEEDVDHALDYLERMFKKFRDRLRNLENDTAKPGTPL